MKAIFLQSLIFGLLIIGCNYTTKEKGNIIDINQKIPKYLKVMKYKYHLGIQDSSGSLNEETFFDSLGNITENSNYNGEIENKNIFRYDSKNRLSEHLTFDKDGRLKLRTIYSYDVRNKIIKELSSYREVLDYVDKIMYKDGEKTYQYEYYNDSLLSKKIMFNNKVKKIITEYGYDSHSRLINTYVTENGKSSYSEKLFYYDNNKIKGRIKSFSNGKWVWGYSFNGDTIKIVAYNSNGKIEFKRIDILDSNGRYISMQGFDSSGEPEYINKFYYEYY